MAVAIAAQGWLGAWGADVSPLLRHHPEVAWQNFAGHSLAWDVGRGVLCPRRGMLGGQ